MILALLLQFTVFESYVQQAAANMGVKGVSVQQGVINYGTARNLAWVNNCTNFQQHGCGLNVVFIAHDTTRYAPPPVLMNLAYHEVCHIRLGHHLNYLRNAAADETAVGICMIQVLGGIQYAKLEGARRSWEPIIIKLREAQFGPSPWR